MYLVIAQMVERRTVDVNLSEILRSLVRFRFARAIFFGQIIAYSFFIIIILSKHIKYDVKTFFNLNNTSNKYNRIPFTDCDGLNSTNIS